MQIIKNYRCARNETCPYFLLLSLKKKVADLEQDYKIIANTLKISPTNKILK